MRFVAVRSGGGGVTLFKLTNPFMYPRFAIRDLVSVIRDLRLETYRSELRRPKLSSRDSCLGMGTRCDPALERHTEIERLERKMRPGRIRRGQGGSDR